MEQPARPSRSAYSVETFRGQLAQEIGHLDSLATLQEQVKFTDLYIFLDIICFLKLLLLTHFM